MKKEALEYCVFCGGLHEYEVRTSEERVVVFDTPVMIERHRAYCKDCGEEIDVPSLFAADQKAAFEEYKRMKGLVTAKEIISFRKEHGLTAAQYAKILCLGEKTITRLENGGIQSESVDLLLRLSMFKGIFDYLCKKAGIKKNHAIEIGNELNGMSFNLVLKKHADVVPVYESHGMTEHGRWAPNNNLMAFAGR